jgi:hypothetical protein
MVKRRATWVLYRCFSALVVCVVAYSLFRCHFEGHPEHYGWPAFWYSNATTLRAEASHFAGETATISPRDSYLYTDDFRPIQLRERDATYLASHLIWGAVTAITLLSTWIFLTNRMPLLWQAPRFTLRSLLLTTAMVAFIVVLMQVRPWAKDFERAKAAHSDYGTVYVGVDPTSTWSPWYRRGPVILGIVSNLYLLEGFLIRLSSRIAAPLQR